MHWVSKERTKEIKMDVVTKNALDAFSRVFSRNQVTVQFLHFVHVPGRHR